MMTTYEEHVQPLAAWRDAFDQWLTGWNIPTGEGVVNKPANGAVVMDVSTRSAELTVALLESAAPVAALWDPGGDEENKPSLLTHKVRVDERGLCCPSY